MITQKFDCGCSNQNLKTVHLNKREKSYYCSNCKVLVCYSDNLKALLDTGLFKHEGELEIEKNSCHPRLVNVKNMYLSPKYNSEETDKYDPVDKPLLGIEIFSCLLDFFKK